jgi:hypothetical protein
MNSVIEYSERGWEEAVKKRRQIDEQIRPAC